MLQFFKTAEQRACGQCGALTPYVSAREPICFQCIEKLSVEHLTLNQKMDMVDAKILSAFKVSFSEVYKNRRSRKRKYVEPRQAIMFVRRRYCKMSLRESADLFLQDHSTASHACKTIDNLMLWDISFKRKLQPAIEYAKAMSWDKD